MKSKALHLLQLTNAHNCIMREYKQDIVTWSSQEFFSLAWSTVLMSRGGGASAQAHAPSEKFPRSPEVVVGHGQRDVVVVAVRLGVVGPADGEDAAFIAAAAAAREVVVADGSSVPAREPHTFAVRKWQKVTFFLTDEVF